MKRVLILGAGAAGLACAMRLREAGVTCTVIEARDRIGGRTISVENTFPAVELGAEFIHGAERPMMDFIEEKNLSFTDVCDNHLFYDRKKLHESRDFWDKIERITSKLSKDRSPDRSLTDFLKAHHRSLPQHDLGIFKSFIEGFEAADLDIIGERGLAEAEGNEESEFNGQSQFRPGRGYSHFIHELHKAAKIPPAKMHLKNEVTRIAWDQKNIQVFCKRKDRPFLADILVVTLPIGVLKDKPLFAPLIPKMEKALATVHMGHALRLSFKFSHRFWESLSQRPVSFLHAGPEFYFPTWWTQAPHRSHILTAWQGGPKAFELSLHTEAERIHKALTTLSILTGQGLRFLKKHCLEVYFHNWSQDPYCLGAYSYMGIQNNGENALLRHVFEGKIILAGEGTTTGAMMGTVHGAIKSGLRAADQVLKIR